MVEPWEQQPDESPEAFEAFRVYRDLGEARSHLKVCDEIGKARSLISRWSADHDWVARAAAWDFRTDKERQRANLDGIAEMSRRHAMVAQAGISAIGRVFGEVLRRIKDDPEILEEMAFDDLLGSLHRASANLPRLTTTEREARGVPTIWVQISQMDDDELARFTNGLLAEGHWGESDEEPQNALSELLEATG